MKPYPVYHQVMKRRRAVFLHSMSLLAAACLFPLDLARLHQFLHENESGVSVERALDSRTRMTASTRFSHATTLSARKPASFWRENLNTVVILVRGFVVVSKQERLPFE